jgi:hypothetical protein
LITCFNSLYAASGIDVDKLWFMRKSAMAASEQID